MKKVSELEARWDSQMDSELGRSLEILRVSPKSVLAMVSYSEYPLAPRKASQRVHLMSAILMDRHLEWRKVRVWVRRLDQSSASLMAHNVQQHYSKIVA